MKTIYVLNFFNSLGPSDDASVNEPSLVQIMACHLMPSHYLNQWWNIINSTHRNKLKWNFNQNLYIFIQKNAFENVFCEMAAILS